MLSPYLPGAVCGVPPRRCALQIRRRIRSSLRRRAADGAQPACGRRLSYNAPHRMRCDGRLSCNMQRPRTLHRRVGDGTCARSHRGAQPRMLAGVARLHSMCVRTVVRSAPHGRAAQIRAATAAYAGSAWKETSTGVRGRWTLCAEPAARHHRLELLHCAGQRNRWGSLPNARATKQRSRARAA